MNIRKITSLTALIAFVLIIVTSIILYIVPHGRIAYWSDWHLWGLSKTEWGNLHINLGVLFLLAIFLHIYYNWKPIVNYMRNKAKKVTVFTKNFNAALIVTLIVGIGTYFMVPPFSTILIFSGNIKDAGAIKYGEPPFGHAELAPLDSLIKKTGLELETSLNKLKSAGIKVDSPSEIFLEIAKKNKTTPKRIFEIIQPLKETGQKVMLPGIPAPGMGNKTFLQFCKEYELDPEIVSTNLKSKGLQINTSEKLKALAAENQISSIQFYDFIKQVSKK
ncbi:MAG: DUF4405 domain-containing protein [Desulfobacteraceae bacterium]|nr:DUF4405 domain-containing protein [Desulfobacteraceae bacterium]